MALRVGLRYSPQLLHTEFWVVGAGAGRGENDETTRISGRFIVFE
jgi:hypothetical protein